MTAFRPEPQTLLTVTAPTESGRPAKMADWRAGFWPRPAPIKLPMITSSILFPAMPVRSTRALTQAAPSSGAGTAARAPFMAPIGVRKPATINDRSLMSRFLSDAFDVQLFELAGVDDAGGACHQVGSSGRLGEGDAIADIGQPGVEHHQAVDAQRDAAVRRGAVAQGAQQEAEFFLCLFERKPQQ